MARIKGKGTVLSITVAGQFVAIPAIIDLSGPDFTVEHAEDDTLDKVGPGIPSDVTGRTEPGSIGGNLFLDPASTGHKNLTALLTTPAITACKLQFADTATTSWPFSGIFEKLGLGITLKEMVKAPFSIKLADLPTFPT